MPTSSSSPRVTRRPAVGDIVWFLKSMRQVRVVSDDSRAHLTVERLDTGKRMTATPRGLLPLAALTITADGECTVSPSFAHVLR